MSTTLPNEASHDSPAETMPTLSNYWHPICTSEEVTEQPKQFKLLGDTIVAFRDENGVAAFKDLCVHRGVALSLGWVENGEITCPYHGWRYDRTGKCVHIPSLPEGSSIPAKARAIAYQAQEKYGLVWVAQDDPVAPIPDWPDGEWEDPAFTGFLSARYHWKTSPGRAIENFMDISHLPWVHDNVLTTREHVVAAPHDVVEFTNGQGDGFRFTYDVFEPNEIYSALGAWTPWEYFLHIPFTVHLRRALDNGEVTILTLIASPTSPTETDMFFFIVRNHHLDEDGGKWRDYCDFIMGQDHPIVESQRPEMIPVDLRDELHLKVPDAVAITYRRQLSKIDHVKAFGP